MLLICIKRLITLQRLKLRGDGVINQFVSTVRSLIAFSVLIVGDPCIAGNPCSRSLTITPLVSKSDLRQKLAQTPGRAAGLYIDRGADGRVVGRIHVRKGREEFFSSKTYFHDLAAREDVVMMEALAKLGEALRPFRVMRLIKFFKRTVRVEFIEGRELDSLYKENRQSAVLQDVRAFYNRALSQVSTRLQGLGFEVTIESHLDLHTLVARQQKTKRRDYQLFYISPSNVLVEAGTNELVIIDRI